MTEFTTQGTTLIYANFVTRIDHPGDAIDSHGRFVGDIIVGTAAGKSINTWLVENGWAYPLFYDSMTAIEIQTLLDAWKIGRKLTRRPGRAIVRKLQPFASSRNVKNASLPDGGKLNFPKIFRRQAAFWVQMPGDLTTADFVAKLTAKLPGKADTAYPCSYYLQHIQNLDKKKRVKLSSMFGQQGQILFKPEDLVFTEDPSKLLDAAGSKVTSW